MKKLCFCALFVSLAFLLVSCGNKEKKNNTEEIKFVKSVLFYEEGSLWTENEKGEMEWYKTLSCGDVLDTYPTAEGSTSEITESKLAVRSGKTEQIDYTKVRYIGKDYWIQSALIIPNSTARLIIGEDTVVYSDAEITSVTNTVIPEGKFVAYLGEKKDEESGITFANIAYKAPNKALRNVYIKAENLSSYEDDVVAKKVLKIIPTYKNETVKKELLDNLNNLRVGMKISEEINELHSQLYPEEKTEITEETDETDSYEEDETTESENDSETAAEETSTTSTTSSNSGYDDYYEFD